MTKLLTYYRVSEHVEVQCIEDVELSELEYIFDCDVEDIDEGMNTDVDCNHFDVVDTEIEDGMYTMEKFRTLCEEEGESYELD